MEEIQKGHEISLMSAEIFLEDITTFDLHLVTNSFITENLKVAKDHLKTVQSASLYWNGMTGEESILKYLQKSKDIRTNLNQFIKDAELKQKHLLETSNAKEVKALDMLKKGKKKETKQVPRYFGNHTVNINI